MLLRLSNSFILFTFTFTDFNAYGLKVYYSRCLMFTATHASCFRHVSSLEHLACLARSANLPKGLYIKLVLNLLYNKLLQNKSTTVGGLA